MDIYREPCPHRIITDLGGAFAMGAIGGTIYHFIRGAYGAPHGERFSTALYAVRSKAPFTGGSFAVWGGLFSTFDCSLAYLRKREDPFNSIGSGAITGGILAARLGWRMSLKSALFGGFLLALIEGVAFVLSRQSMETNIISDLDEEEEALLKPPNPVWTKFKSIFNVKQKEEQKYDPGLDEREKLFVDDQDVDQLTNLRNAPKTKYDDDDHWNSESHDNYDEK